VTFFTGILGIKLRQATHVARRSPPSSATCLAHEVQFAAPEHFNSNLHRDTRLEEGGLPELLQACNCRNKCRPCGQGGPIQLDTALERARYCDP
jgi:hypothetical protein